MKQLLLPPNSSQFLHSLSPQLQLSSLDLLVGTAINPGITNTPQLRLQQIPQPLNSESQSDKDLELKKNVAYCTVHPISHVQQL